MTFCITPDKTLGICAPSSAITPANFETGLAVLHAQGFKTIIHPQTYSGADTGNQLCGSPEQKAAALMELWADPNVDAIITACGGNFSAQILKHLDFDLIQKNPKPLMGFSDTTALLSAIYAKTGIGGIFGPTVQTLGRITQIPKVFDILSGKPQTEIECHDVAFLSDNKECAAAPLFAMTLSVFMALIGTPYLPKLNGHFVMIEDIGEELSHLDRMLWQLNAVCPFQNMAGLGFGEFVDLKDTGRPLGLSFENIIRKHTKDAGIPVFSNLPFGHGQNFMPIPIGRRGAFDATNRTLILE